MDSFAGNCSQQSKQSQDSFDWSEFDDALDLDQPPSFNSTISPLDITSYSSQLILNRSSQRSNSTKVDSGFGIDSSAFQSPASQVSFEGQKRHTNHGLTSVSSPRQSVGGSDDDSGCSNSPIECSLPSKKSRLESPIQRISSTQSTFRSPLKPATLNRLRTNCDEAALCQRQTTDKSNNHDNSKNDEQTNATNSNDDTENLDDNTIQQQSTPAPNESLPNPIHLKIAPVLNLMAQIKTQYSDYAFVYALAAHMCKDIYPRDVHISLKTALLLSIVSCNVMPREFYRNHCFSFMHSVHSILMVCFCFHENSIQGQNDEQPISIMAIARDSAVASSVMGSIGRVAKRYTNTKPSAIMHIFIFI